MTIQAALLFLVQSLGECLEAKSQFIKKVIPELQPLRVLREERDAAIRRAEEAEATTGRLSKRRFPESKRKIRSSGKKSSISGAVCGVRVFHPTATSSCS